MVAFRVTFLPNSVVLSQFWRDGRPRATCLFRSIQVSLKSDTFVVSSDIILFAVFYWKPIGIVETNITNNFNDGLNQRLPGACNRSPGSKLLSITTQLHCGSYLGGRARLPDTILEEDHPMTISSKFGSNWATGSRQDFYVNFP